MNDISLLHIALIYLAVVNVVTFFVYGIDKWRSTSGRLLPTGRKNAIVGIDIDYETIGETRSALPLALSKNSMLMVATSGTAVVI